MSSTQILNQIYHFTVVFYPWIIYNSATCIDGINYGDDIFDTAHSSSSNPLGQTSPFLINYYVVKIVLFLILKWQWLWCIHHILISFLLNTKLNVSFSIINGLFAIETFVLGGFIEKTLLLGMKVTYKS